MFSRFSGMFSQGGNRGHGNPNPNNNGPANNGNQRRASPGPSAQKKPCKRAAEKDGPESEGSSCQVDNSLAVIEKIASLYAERLLSDVTLVINGVEFPAHRLILCSSSDVFQVMLMNSVWSESHETRVVLLESPECKESFEDFLKYLYTGKLKLELTNAMHLLTLADKYNVKDLVKLCLDYMKYHIPAAASESQLIRWFYYTSGCGHCEVAEMCKNFIKWNFDMVAKTEDFHLLDLELMISILKNDDIVVEDEYTLYLYLDFWIDCQRGRHSANDPNYDEIMFNIVQQSIQLIRFPMMAPRQLADMLLSPLTQQYKELFMEKMAIGMAFHSGIVERICEMVESHPNKSKLFTPRLYCTDKWSVCLMIENFSALNYYQSKTLVFSSPISASERFSEKQIEWVVDFYPKGVCFKKGLLIIWQGTLECPEYVKPTVRLSVNCKSDEDTEVRVQIGVLIYGVQDGVEHIRSVSKKNYIFSGRDKVVNIDDVLPYDELTPCAACKTNSGTLGSRIGNFTNGNRGLGCNYSGAGTSLNRATTPHVAGSCLSATEKSCFLVGEQYDSLKVRIVITPMSELNF